MYFRYDVALHQEEVCVKQVLNLSRMHMYFKYDVEEQTRCVVLKCSSPPVSCKAT